MCAGLVDGTGHKLAEGHTVTRKIDIFRDFYLVDRDVLLGAGLVGDSRDTDLPTAARDGALALGREWEISGLGKEFNTRQELWKNRQPRFATVRLLQLDS